AMPTTDDVDNVLRQVPYRNTSDNPAENVTLAVTVKDGNTKWNGAQGQGGEGRVVGEITVGLVNVNDAPEARRNSVRIDEDGCHTFDASDFRFKDAEGDDLKAVIITNLPTNGTLYYCDEEITAEQLLDGGYSIKACDLDKLTFKPDEDFHGKVTFKYMLQDAGGTDNDGEDTSGKATFEIKVRSIND